MEGARLFGLVRAHWRIENNCFGRLDIEWQEDHGRWVHRGNRLPVVSLLRIIAYNLLEMPHAVHLRSKTARKAAWQQLRDWVRDALVWSAEGMPDLPEVCHHTHPDGERGLIAHLTHPSHSEARGGLPPRTSGHPCYLLYLWPSHGSRLPRRGSLNNV